MSFAVNYMAGGRFDTPYFPTKTKAYIEGRRIGIDHAVSIDEFSLGIETEFISFSIAATQYDDYDYWNLFINDEQIFKNIYVKDVPEGFNFSVVMPVPANAIFKFEYHNDSKKQKVVKLNYQLLKD
ncbi:Low copy number virion structural protein [Bacillus cereus]|uniref:Low copy number virion structural protein n=1 Tax=Bacillus cereus TaxID=1396 RepID=UPI003012F7E5